MSQKISNAFIIFGFITDHSQETIGMEVAFNCRFGDLVTKDVVKECVTGCREVRRRRAEMGSKRRPLLRQTKHGTKKTKHTLVDDR